MNGRSDSVSSNCVAARGLTIVESLVVMVVIAILAALMLPALHVARESARRIRCFNNLHQIGLGLHAYHATHRAFPPGAVEWRPSGNTTNRQLAWSVFLLPFVEQQGLFEALNLSKAFDSVENASGAAVVLPVYRCPSSLQPGPRVHGRARCDYGGIYGERITSPNNPPKGVMLFDVSVSLSQIIDGTTYTLIISEDTGWPDGQWINGKNVFDQAFAVNSAPSFENDIRSEHPGGANGLFVDGSVRFLSETMELRVLGAICTRAGGEPLGSL